MKRDSDILGRRAHVSVEERNELRARGRAGTAHLSRVLKAPASAPPKGATDPGTSAVRARPCCAGAFSRLTVGPTSVDRGSTEGQPRRGVSPTASERP